MSRGYRIFILAIGLALAGPTAPPQHQGQGKEPATQAKPAPTESPTVDIGQSKDYQKPCDRQERNRNSDLCAQWTAADAARDAADWSYVSLWLTGASLFGLLVTLGLLS